MNFDVPSPKPDVVEGSLARSYTAFFSALRNAAVWRSQYGPTAQRPTKLVEPGLPYFDTDLGKPVWVKSVKPIVWVDATGATV